MANQTPAKQIYDLLVTKDFDPELLDSSGRPAQNPAETEVFSFDYTAESGNDYGTVVVMLGDENDLQLFFGDNLGKGMEPEDKDGWFDFLGQMKDFATKNLLTFSPKDLNKLKYSMQGQAAINEGLFESWTGTRTTSWNGKQTEARLMIKHKRALGENDARFRYIESLFIETAEGERYKLPFTKLSGGRAMVEHVRMGGRVYDARGLHITEMVNELNVLSRFRRANHGKIFEGDTAQLVTETNAYYETLQRQLKGLSTNRGYSSYFESWNPNEITEQEVVIEGLKHLFVTQSLDTRIEDALPLLAKIQQQGQAMKEANIFEAWANQLMEGTWAIPDTKQKQAQLVQLMSKEFPVGADATNATEQLYDLFGDDELFDQLEALAAKDADADCRQVVYDRMQMLSDNPDVKAVIDAVQIDPTAEMNPAPQVNPDTINESEVTIGDIVECPGGVTGEIIADEGDRWVVRDLDSEFKDDVLEFRKSDCIAQLDELSPDTLKSYIKKAGSSSHKNSASNLASRAADKLAQAHNPGVEDDGYDDDHKSYMRSKGIARAVDKLEELSPDTLKSYAKDAALDNARRGNTLGYLRGKPTKSGALEKDIGDKIARRQQGISKALDRLEEGGMSEADALIQDIISGDVDIYKIYSNPKDKVEQYVSDIIRDKVEELSYERPDLHHDDDIDRILQIVYDDLDAEYGVEECMDYAMEEPRADHDVEGGMTNVLVKGVKDNQLEEGTALTGPYGHKGKLQPVQANQADADMMDRIKFLAGLTK